MRSCYVAQAVLELEAILWPKFSRVGNIDVHCYVLFLPHLFILGLMYPRLARTHCVAEDDFEFLILQPHQS